MKVLELFSGTHSIGKVCKEHGYEVVSVDRDLGSKCPFGTDYESDLHIQKDIMTWDYKKDFKVGEFEKVSNLKYVIKENTIYNWVIVKNQIGMVLKP